MRGCMHSKKLFCIKIINKRVVSFNSTESVFYLAYYMLCTTPQFIISFILEEGSTGRSRQFGGKPGEQIF